MSGWHVGFAMPHCNALVFAMVQLAQGALLIRASAVVDREDLGSVGTESCSISPFEPEGGEQRLKIPIRTERRAGRRSNAPFSVRDER